MTVRHSLSGDRAWAAPLLAALALCATQSTPASGAAAADLYTRNCASCHGPNLQGSGLGPALSRENYRYGGRREDLIRVITNGVPSKQMPAFAGVLSTQEIDALAGFLPVRTGEEPEPAAPRDFSKRKDGGVVRTLDYILRVEIFVDGLRTPWAMVFLDDRTALVTERPGRLRVVKEGRLLEAPVSGTPEVFVHSHEWNQGGLLDVAIEKDHAQTGWVYLTYSHELPRRAVGATPVAMTRVIRGRIRDNRWVDQQVLFEGDPSTYAEQYWHYGGRMALDDRGHLYFSVGDRGAQELAREPGRPTGKIHRIMANGAIPQDNPLRGQQGALGSIYSHGHRNPQGLTIEPSTGRIWSTEHGPRGGDELNIIARGADYGWPVVSYGINYDGTVLTPHSRAEGVQQPIYYWRPSIGVAGLAFYEADEFPLWKGRLLVGSLNRRELRLLNIEDNRVMHEEVILEAEGRPYEPVVGPDGAIYVVTDDPGRILRLTAQQERRQ
jgi:glucose/arabinose dehydrogenase